MSGDPFDMGPSNRTEITSTRLKVSNHTREIHLVLMWDVEDFLIFTGQVGWPGEGKTSNADTVNLSA